MHYNQVLAVRIYGLPAKKNHRLLLVMHANYGFTKTEIAGKWGEM